MIEAFPADVHNIGHLQLCPQIVQTAMHRLVKKIDSRIPEKAQKKALQASQIKDLIDDPANDRRDHRFRCRGRHDRHKQQKKTEPVSLCRTPDILIQLHSSLPCHPACNLLYSAQAAADFLSKHIILISWCRGNLRRKIFALKSF